MKELSQKYSVEMQSIWRPEPTVPGTSPLEATIFGDEIPEYQRMATIEPADMKAEQALRSRQLLPETPHMPEISQMTITPPRGPTSDVEESSDDDDEKFNKIINMEKLKQRGKGSYFCPKGKKCDKGGVDKSGNLVKFDRNSSFA